MEYLVTGAAIILALIFAGMVIYAIVTSVALHRNRETRLQDIQKRLEQIEKQKQEPDKY